MIIKKLILKNIRSYTKIELDFSIGATLLSGDIGAGKTSILLGLQFALFGLQPGQKGAAILRQNEDNASATVILEIEGREVEIERTLKKSKNGSITQEENIIRMEGIEEILSSSELKNRVISLLDYPREFAKKSDLLYKYTVYTPQEGMKEIIEERSSIRLDLIRHIFGVDRYKRIKENSQLFLQKIKENIKIKEVQAREINNLREKLVLINEEKIKVARDLLDYSVNLEKAISEKEQFSAKIETMEKKLEEISKIGLERSKKEGELQGKIALKDRLEKEIKLYKTQLSEKTYFRQESLTNVSERLIEHRKNLESLSSQFTEVVSKIYSLNSQKENSFILKEKVISLENCPTCHQSVAHEHKERISKKTTYEIEDINRELEQKIILKNRLVKDIEVEKDLIKNYEQDKSFLEAEKIKFEHQKTVETKIKSDTIVLERTLWEEKSLAVELGDLSKRLLEFEKEKEVFEQEKLKFEELDLKSRKLEVFFAEKRKESEMLKKQLDQIELELAQKEVFKSQMFYLKNLQSWLEEKFLPLMTFTETNVMVTLRRDFSKVFNEWFSVLVPNYLSVRLDEDFTPIVTNQDYEMDYSFLSGGERTAVALAYRLALNQIINSRLSKLKTKDILILDEPTDGFSEQQLDKMRDIFEQLQAKQIILVSHEQKIEGFVDNIIRIKKDGTSKIESKKTSNII